MEKGVLFFVNAEISCPQAWWINDWSWPPIQCFFPYSPLPWPWEKSAVLENTDAFQQLLYLHCSTVIRHPSADRGLSLALIWLWHALFLQETATALWSQPFLFIYLFFSKSLAQHQITLGMLAKHISGNQTNATLCKALSVPYYQILLLQPL